MFSALRTTLCRVSPAVPNALRFRLVSSAASRLGNALIWGNILETVSTPSSSVKSPVSPEEVWRANSVHYMQSIHPPTSIYAGRSIEVGKSGMSIAWMSLHRSLRLDNIAKELKAAERYEKPGPKRRRLRSERWRRRFAEEVRRKVRLVNEIRRRGA